MKNIVCVTDSLNSGGAQRQMVKLTNYFVSNNISVHLVVVHPIFVIENLLIKNEFLTLYKPQKSSYFECFNLLFQFAKKSESFVFLSYLNGPNYLLLVLKLFFPKIFICISERRGFIRHLNFFSSFKYFLYGYADVLVFNSFDVFDKISKNVFSIKSKSKIIYNLTDTSLIINALNKTMNECRISFVANYRPEKNHRALIDSLSISVNKFDGINVNCFGNTFFNGNIPTKDSNFFLQVLSLVKERDLSNIIKLNNYVDDTSEIFLNSEFVLLLSKYEGFPNVVCEGMMNGTIILCTRVSDVDKFIIHKINGYILNNDSSEEILNAFNWAKNLNEDEKKFASILNIKIARNYFDCELNGRQYLNLFQL